MTVRFVYFSKVHYSNQIKTPLIRSGSKYSLVCGVPLDSNCLLVRIASPWLSQNSPEALCASRGAATKGTRASHFSNWFFESLAKQRYYSGFAIPIGSHRSSQSSDTSLAFYFGSKYAFGRCFDSIKASCCRLDPVSLLFIFQEILVIPEASILLIPSFEGKFPA